MLLITLLVMIFGVALELRCGPSWSSHVIFYLGHQWKFKIHGFRDPKPFPNSDDFFHWVLTSLKCAHSPYRCPTTLSDRPFALIRQNPLPSIHWPKTYRSILPLSSQPLKQFIAILLHIVMSPSFRPFWHACETGRRTAQGYVRAGDELE